MRQKERQNSTKIGAQKGKLDIDYTLMGRYFHQE